MASYREASVEVIEVMSRFAVIERASIDEAYMDLTSSVQKRLKDLEASRIDPQLLKNTYVQGFPAATSEEDALIDKGVFLKPFGEKVTVKSNVTKLPAEAEMTAASLFLCVEERRSKGLQQWLDTLPSCSQPGCLGYSEVCLAVGAMIVEEMRAAVEQQTGFRCSAGISHNKVFFFLLFVSLFC